MQSRENHDRKSKTICGVTGSDEIDIGRLVGTVIEARWWCWGRRPYLRCARNLYVFATPIYSADALVQIEQNAGNSLVQDINSALANKPPASDAEIQAHSIAPGAGEDR
ncbi:tyrosine kinase [Salmonella enterica subsp. enterica]|uniref:Tyrosine kinase n=1 Tax=Salmonella enterica I TaxID=59201 RepID=A0A379WSV7_SALET|nr:tyrosine kinase [Salmonella enterica subsp. enterica]